MAWDLVVGKSTVDLATFNGWKMFKNEVSSTAGDELKKFIADGHADAELLVADLEDLSDLSDSSQSIVDGMLDAMSGKTGDCRISDGLE